LDGAALDAAALDSPLAARGAALGAAALGCGALRFFGAEAERAVGFAAVLSFFLAAGTGAFFERVLAAEARVAFEDFAIVLRA